MGRRGGQRLRRRAGVQRRGHLRARGRQDPARHPLLRRAVRAARVEGAPGRADGVLGTGSRTSENAVKAKFAEFGFSALARSFFDGAAPLPNLGHIAQTVNARAYAGATCRALQTFVARRCKGHEAFGKSTADVLLTKPPIRRSRVFRFYGICRQKREPTSGLEPLTCSLRVSCSTS